MSVAPTLEGSPIAGVGAHPSGCRPCASFLPQVLRTLRLLRGDRVAVITVPKLLRGDRVAVGCALSVLCIVFYNYFIQFFSNFEPQATLQIVVQAFELRCSDAARGYCAESSFFLNLLFFRVGRPPSPWGLCGRGSAVRGASLTDQSNRRSRLPKQEGLARRPAGGSPLGSAACLKQEPFPDSFQSPVSSTTSNL